MFQGDGINRLKPMVIIINPIIVETDNSLFDIFINLQEKAINTPIITGITETLITNKYSFGK